MNPALAAVERSPAGAVLKPVADGDGGIRISHAGHAVELPLRVVEGVAEANRGRARGW